MAGIKKIFIVDDDDFFREMLADSLKKFLWLQTQQFENGEECLKNLFAMQPDLVILDYNLNDNDPKAKNGLEILNEIKKQSPATRVIILSGQNKYGVAMQSISKGAEHYVMKDNDAFKTISSIVEGYK